MNKLCGVLLLSGLFLLSLIVQAQDIPTITVQDDNPSDTRLSAVNVRSAPYGYIYGVLYEGDTLTVTGRTDFDISEICTGNYFADRDKWFRVDLQGIEGWVSKCAVQFSGVIASVPIVEAPSTTPRQATLCYTGCMRDELGTIPDVVFVIAASRFNIRIHELPSVQSPVLEVANAPEMYVIGRTADNQWIRVQYAEVITPLACWYCQIEHRTQQGWVARFLLNLPAGWEDNIPVVG